MKHSMFARHSLRHSHACSCIFNNGKDFRNSTPAKLPIMPGQHVL